MRNWRKQQRNLLQEKQSVDMIAMIPFPLYVGSRECKACLSIYMYICRRWGCAVYRYRIRKKYRGVESDDIVLYNICACCMTRYTA